MSFLRSHLNPVCSFISQSRTQYFLSCTWVHPSLLLIDHPYHISLAFSCARLIDFSIPKWTTLLWPNVNLSHFAVLRSYQSRWPNRTSLLVWRSIISAMSAIFLGKTDECQELSVSNVSILGMFRPQYCQVPGSCSSTLLSERGLKKEGPIARTLVLW